MALNPDQGEDGRQDLDSDDAVSGQEDRAKVDDRTGANGRVGASDRAGTDDRAGVDDKAGIDDGVGADNRAGASPAPTIYEEGFEGPSYSGGGDGEEQEGWRSSLPVDFFQDLGYGPAPGGRGSLRDAIWELLERYIFVIRHPTSDVFRAEKEKADWDVVWIELLANAVIAGLLGLLSMVIPFAGPGTASSNGTGLQSPDVVHALNLSTTVGLIAFIPVIFFVGSGILRLLARGFGGNGSFLEQCYTTLLFQMPFGIAVSVLRLLPFVGGFFFWFGSLAALLYGIVLQILATMAVYQLNGDKATPAVIITAVILIPVTILLFAFLTFMFALIGPIL